MGKKKKWANLSQAQKDKHGTKKAWKQAKKKAATRKNSPAQNPAKAAARIVKNTGGAKYNQLSDVQKTKVDRKTYKQAKQTQAVTPSPSPAKPKAAAVQLINQDKGKLKAKDAERIAGETGLSVNKIIKLAQNKVSDKVIGKKLTKPTSNQPTPTPTPTTPGVESPAYGERIGAPPGTMGTHDFKDSDGDGVDDRQQPGAGMPDSRFETSEQPTQGWQDAKTKVTDFKEKGAKAGYSYEGSKFDAQSFMQNLTANNKTWQNKDRRTGSTSYNLNLM